MALEESGDFAVVWSSEGSSGTDSSATSIQSQRYASDGSPVAGEFQINTLTGGSQFSPSMALDADGEFVVTWTSSASLGTDRSYLSVQKTPAKLIFADGFESGDTGAWK